MSLRQEIAEAINRNSAENGSNTPDYILAEYLADCLNAFDKATKTRDAHRGDKSRTSRASKCEHRWSRTAQGSLDITQCQKCFALKPKGA